MPIEKAVLVGSIPSDLHAFGKFFENEVKVFAVRIGERVEQATKHPGGLTLFIQPGDP
jgi:hypothetical protein